MAKKFNKDDYELTREIECGNAIVAVYRPRQQSAEQRAVVEREIKAALAEFGKEMYRVEAAAKHAVLCK